MYKKEMNKRNNMKEMNYDLFKVKKYCAICDLEHVTLMSDIRIQLVKE